MSLQTKHIYEFGPFRLDAAERLLLREGKTVPLTPKAFDLLLALVEGHGHLLEKDELLKSVWPDTFVEEANLASNISLVRKALGDGENGHRYIETAPKRGYRFVASVQEVEAESRRPSAASLPGLEGSVNESGSAADSDEGASANIALKVKSLTGVIMRRPKALILALAMIVPVGAAIVYATFLIRQRSQLDHAPRTLARVTYDRGLQSEPTWAPDGHFIAYSSDRNGNFDIWVQPVSGGNPKPITSDPAHEWQPDWSPDGSRIVFRSERDGGGLFVIPSLGGPARKISPFGYRPRWSRDGSQILFYDSVLRSTIEPPGIFVVGLDGNPPRQVLADFLSGFGFPKYQGVAWHPDNLRVSVLWESEEGGWNFWTVPLDGGAPIKSEISIEVERQIKGTSLGLSRFPWSIFDNLLWSPSGDAIFFEAQSKGIRNLWKVTVDKKSLRWVSGPERLTTGPGSDTDIALSRDGKKLAYTTRAESTRIWVLPFDAVTGKVNGEGKAVTEAGMDIIAPRLSPDGRKLGYLAHQTGRRELWFQSLDDGHKSLLLAGDESARISGADWSRDGARMIFRRPPTTKPGVTEMEGQIVSIRADGSDEQALNSTTVEGTRLGELTRDGQWMLRNFSRGNPRYGICLYPVAAAPQDETQARIVAAHPEYNLWQAHFSPDDRWISFNAVKAADAALSSIYIVPISGGEWTRITESKYWDDKPRWSPDGKTIYFLSNRTGFFNVWGIRFDPAHGKPMGEPFRVTTYESSSRMILPLISDMEMSITADRLMLPLMEAYGNIWVVENVDR